MMQPLVGKQIFIVEDEPAFRSFMDSWSSSLGAITAITGDGLEALDLFGHFKPDPTICDLTMPRMSGLKLVEYLRNRGNQTPILVISATKNMSDITKALRLGVDDVLLKPMKDLNRLRETILARFHPNMFNSRVGEEGRPFHDWDAMVDDSAVTTKLLKELQPPAPQMLSYCRINYRQLVAVDQPGLVLDVTPLSDHDLAFYCPDVTRAGDNGVLAALLL